MSEAKLIKKDLDGVYTLTPFGNLALSLLSGINVVSDNREYFSTHDLSKLPYELVERLGELSAVPVGTSDIMTSFRLSEIMLQQANEYMWVMSDQILTSVIPIIGERMRNGVEFRFIFPQNMIPPPGVKPEPEGTEKKTAKG